MLYWVLCIDPRLFILAFLRAGWNGLSFPGEEIKDQRSYDSILECEVRFVLWTSLSTWTTLGRRWPPLSSTTVFLAHPYGIERTDVLLSFCNFGACFWPMALPEQFFFPCLHTRGLITFFHVVVKSCLCMKMTQLGSSWLPSLYSSPWWSQIYLFSDSLYF